MSHRATPFFSLIGSSLLVCATSSAGLTAAQWKEDLVTLRSAVSEHPAPFRKIPKAEFDRQADAVAADLPKLQDYQVIARMAALIALLGDGHSRLRLPMVKGAELFGSHSKIKEAKVAPFGYFPIRLTQTADGLLVTRTTPEQQDLLGAELTGIGEHSIAEVDAAISPMVHADNPFAKSYLIPDFMVIPEILAAAQILPLADHGLLKFRLANGENLSRDLAAVHDSAPTKWIELRKIDRPAPETRLRITRLPNGIIVAHLAEILSDPHETVQEFSEKVFAAVERISGAVLVLDLRNNPGGDNTLDDAIVRGAIRSKRVWEPGRFFVLINPGTFSAASNLVSLLDRWTPAIFVGEPTGGAPNSYGDPKRTVLPNSGLTLQVSSLYWQLSSPKDQRNATEPLLPAKLTVASVRAHKDVALELINSLTEKPATTSGNFSGQLAISGQRVDLAFKLTKEGVWLDLPAVQISGKQLDQGRQHDGLVTGTLTLDGHHLLVHGRLTGRHFVGWMGFDGRPYAFVTEQSAANR